MSNHRSTQPRRLSLLAAGLAVLLASAWLCPTEASACPNCKTGLPTDIDETTATPAQLQRASLGKGYNYSIMLMMPVPFLLAGILGGVVYYQLRKHDAAAARAETRERKSHQAIEPPSHQGADPPAPDA